MALAALLQIVEERDLVGTVKREPRRSNASTRTATVPGIIELSVASASGLMMVPFTATYALLTTPKCAHSEMASLADADRPLMHGDTEQKSDVAKGQTTFPRKDYLVRLDLVRDPTTDAVSASNVVVLQRLGDVHQLARRSDTVG